MGCAWCRARHKRHYGQPKVGQKRRSRKYRFDTEMVCPVVTRAAEKKNGTRSSVESAPFCPRVFLLSVHPSGRWLVGAVGIEPTTSRLFMDLQGRARYEKEGLSSPRNPYCRLSVALPFMMVLTTLRFASRTALGTACG